jgi:hypothetical protein
MRRLGILVYLENVKGILGACERVAVCRHVCSCCCPRQKLDGCWSRQWWTHGKVTESWAWKLHAAHAHLGVLHLQYWLAWPRICHPPLVCSRVFHRVQNSHHAHACELSFCTNLSTIKAVQLMISRTALLAAGGVTDSRWPTTSKMQYSKMGEGNMHL